MQLFRLEAQHFNCNNYCFMWRGVQPQAVMRSSTLNETKIRRLVAMA